MYYKTDQYITLSTYVKLCCYTKNQKGHLLPWSYRSWIYNYLCNQCPSPLKLWVRIPLMAMCTRYNLHVIKFVNDLWQVSHTNETDRHDIAEILLKVALNTISLTPSPKLTHSLLMCCVLWRCNSLSSGNAQEVRYRSVSITQMVYRRYIYLSVCW
jgi:hypothetical protein